MAVFKMNPLLCWKAKLLWGGILIVLWHGVSSDSYYPESISDKVESACQAFLVDVVASRSEAGGYQDYRFFYNANVLDSWHAEWDKIEFKTQVDIGVGRRVFIVIDECSDSGSLGALSIGLGQEMYLVNKELEKYEDELWLEVSVGTHQIPEGWETYEIERNFSGKYKNRFRSLIILFPFDLVRPLLDHLNGEG